MQADGATAQAKEKTQEVAGQAKEQATQAAGQVKGQARTQLRSQVDQRSTQAGQQISSQASDVRTIAQQLRDQGKDKPAQLAEKAAERVEGIGSYLERSDADRILHDVEDFARQRPWAVIAGGIALGLAASRFLKASSSDRYETRRSSGQLGYQQGGYRGYGATDYGTTGYGTGTTPAVPATGAGYGTAGTSGNELSTGVGGGTPRTDPPAVPATPPTGAPTTGGF